MAWVYLLLAGVCEIVWAIGLKKYGFRPGVGTAVTLIALVVSFVLLSLAMRTLPLGTAYSIWTGIGAVGAAAYGMAYFGEPRDLARLLCIAAIVGGIVGLKFLSPAPNEVEGKVLPVEMNGRA